MNDDRWVAVFLGGAGEEGMAYGEFLTREDATAYAEQTRQDVESSGNDPYPYVVVKLDVTEALLWYSPDLGELDGD